uniref:NADH-ubiquinone oxidoreductase chain 2 n=1 Tax=Hemiphyllodactylus kyaiktiyoensis TaxID=2725495 RepID=A0A6M8Q4J6_9SAUR|nr:NADH dehydrogenase subunit 2 [Hemiphyllodactylus kyaiktiyoensis]QKI36496.1 NADH dehydrogenase subunit 2 [Hemiphyllodactylus kyaiktiyoensis]QKI36497.1 NADH dehydrogenase subunit 2 [Hemiphyllodactylus kyaiktiyoensis]
MNPLIWALLITSLSTSTIITMASHHWLLAWLGLELNTLSILPIIMKTHHPRATEAATKYFIIQTFAAALILFASTINAWQTGHWSITTSSTTQTTTIMTIALMLKLGVAPAHLWYPEILQGVTMNTALTITTWQKIAPTTLLLLLHNHLSTTLLMLTGLTSALIGGLTGLNQTQTRKIMAFSSIAHTGWLLMTLMLAPHLTTMTLIIYILMTIATFTSLNTTTMKTITDTNTTWTNSPALLTLMMLSLMSLGGLPPLTGFMPKLLILNDLIIKNLTPLGVTLALASLPSLFFYIRLTYLTMLINPPNNTNTKYNWRMKPLPQQSTTTTMTLTLFLLPTTPLLYLTT